MITFRQRLQGVSRRHRRCRQPHHYGAQREDHHPGRPVRLWKNDLHAHDQPPGLVENNLVALEDDKSLFAAENVVPVIKTAKQNDTVTKTLNDVSAKLTTDDLITMNAEAATGTNLSDIAKKWLANAGIGSN